jgi:hypothetical protein
VTQHHPCQLKSAGQVKFKVTLMRSSPCQCDDDGLMAIPNLIEATSTFSTRQIRFRPECMALR